MTEHSSPPTLELLRDIVVDASRARSLEEQVDRIVHQVHQVFKVAVCSLYLMENEEQALRLIASQGLDQSAVGQVKLALGDGLIGTIAESQLPLLLDRASSHPAYRYFPETGEQAFDAFLGVPIVHLGNTLGVLVLQDAPPRQFDDEEEAFLVTISAQLSSSLLRWSTGPRGSTGSRRLPIHIDGIRGAPGVAIGRLHFVHGGLDQFSDTGTAVIDPQQELNKLLDAIARTLTDLDNARERLHSTVSTDVLAVFDFYKLMLGSEQLTKAAEQQILQGESAISALRSSVNECALAFETMADPYFQARGEDVRNIGNRLFNALLGNERQLAVDASEVVLIGDLVSVTDIGQFEPWQLAGLVCMKGSALSHTVVLANALGVPAVMGTGKIDGLLEGDTVAIDGHRGRLFIDPPPLLLSEYRQLIAQQQQQQAVYLQVRDLPAETLDGFRMRLMANSGLLADSSPGLDRGAEGIGLYRSEFPFMTRPNFPSEEEQLEVYRQLLSSYQPRPVTIRTLDIGGDKPLPYFSYEEENPGLGWRGIRFTLDNRPVFITQLRAMLRANAEGHNLRILLPMVSRVDEVKDTLELLNAAVSQLSAEGLAFHRPPLGIMVEVPAAIPLLSFIAPHIDFISVGSNDLTQFLLAVDRNNPRVASRYDPLHPAVLHTLVALLREARRLQLEVSVCGEMAADPLAVMLLLGMGVEMLSMSSFSLPKIKYLIRHLSHADAKRWLNQALQLDHERKIREMLGAELEQQQLGYLLAPTDAQP